MYEITGQDSKIKLNMRLPSVVITAREMRKAKVKVDDTSSPFSKVQQFREQNDLLTVCF